MEPLNHPGSRGQSLVELLVGIAIGVIFIAGAATIIAPSLNINKQTTIVQTKTELATELAGNIKAWAAGNWNNVLSLATGTGNSYYLSTATSSFVVVAATTTIINTGGSSPGTISIISAAPTSTNPQEGYGTTFTQSFTTLPQAGDLIAVAMTQTNGGSGMIGVTSITDNQGNGNYILAASSTDGIGGTYIYYAKNIGTPSGTFTVTVTMSAGAYMDIGIYDIRGADPSNPVPAVNTTSTKGSGTNVLTGTLSPGTNAAYIGILTSDNESFGGITPASTWTERWRELSASIGTMDDLDLITSANKAVQWTVSPSVSYVAMLTAFNAQSITTSESSTFSSGTTTQSVGEFINSGSTTYNRYFYVSDVYRDSNGNVTTTASGNNDDPSTKLVTVVVQASSTPVTPAFTTSFYITRNGSNNFTQASWAGSSGQNNPVTVAGTNFYADSDITITATGSIQLTAGGSSCTL